MWLIFTAAHSDLQQGMTPYNPHQHSNLVYHNSGLEQGAIYLVDDVIFPESVRARSWFTTLTSQRNPVGNQSHPIRRSRSGNLRLYRIGAYFTTSIPSVVTTLLPQSRAPPWGSLSSVLSGSHSRNFALGTAPRSRRGRRSQHPVAAFSSAPQHGLTRRTVLVQPHRARLRRLPIGVGGDDRRRRMLIRNRSRHRHAVPLVVQGVVV